MKKVKLDSTPSEIQNTNAKKLKNPFLTKNEFTKAKLFW